MSGKSRFRWVLMLGLIGLLAVLIVWLYPRNHNLLILGKQILNARSEKNLSWYAWLPDRDVLAAFYVNDSHSEEPILYWEHYQLTTGQETRLQGLEARIGPVEFPEEDYELELSADGRGLLRNLADQVIFTSIDGNRHFRQPCNMADPWVQIRWLSDNRRWVELISMPAPDSQSPLNKVLIHTLKYPRHTQTIPIPHSSPFCMADRIGFIDFISQNDRLITLRCNLSRSLGMSIMHNIKIIATGPNLDFSRTQTYSMPLSQNRRVIDIAFSPSGDRIAWLLATEHQAPWTAFLHLCWPAYKGRKEFEVECWVCNLNGTGMRQIGSVGTENASADALELLRWLPDGKGLSFIYKGSLWTVPVS